MIALRTLPAYETRAVLEEIMRTEIGSAHRTLIFHL